MKGDEELCSKIKQRRRTNPGKEKRREEADRELTKEIQLK